MCTDDVINKFSNCVIVASHEKRQSMRWSAWYALVSQHKCYDGSSEEVMLHEEEEKKKEIVSSSSGKNVFCWRATKQFFPAHDTAVGR